MIKAVTFDLWDTMIHDDSDEAAQESEAGPEIIEAALDRVLAAQRAREAA